MNRLVWSAWRNMANAVQSEHTRKAYEQAFDAQAVSGARSDVCDAEWAAARRATLLALAQNESERRGTEAWLEAVDFAGIARALGLEHLPLDEQWREVKRFKDRMKNRVRRRGPKRGNG